MLAAAALRLAVVEALCPTAAIASGNGFPTLARHRVYDSVQVGIDDLDRTLPWTPVLSVYTEDTRISRRGDNSSSVIGNPRTDLVVVAELAEMARDVDGKPLTAVDGSLATDAVINGDTRARLVLDALAAQARAVLVRAPIGFGARRVLKAVHEVSIEPFNLPQYSLRWARLVVRLSCDIADDKFTDDAGLPEPMKSVLADLPDGSYAKAKLAELGAAFLATGRDALDMFSLTATGDGQPVVTPPAPPAP